MGEQRYRIGGYHAPWEDAFWLFPRSISCTPILIYINDKLSSLLLSLVLLLKVDKDGDGEQTYPYYDCGTVVNYMMILPYSYHKTCIYKKKIKKTQPETVE